MTDQISDRVKNELVFMNLIESLQKLWKLLSTESLFNLDEFQNATPDKLTLLYSKSLELVNVEERKQEGYDQELLTLKKELVGNLKKLEEEVKARKQAMINNENAKKENQENENEIFKIDEKIAAVRADLETLIKSKEAAEVKRISLEGGSETVLEKIKENKGNLTKKREIYAELKAKKNKLDEGIKKKISENNEVIQAIKSLEQNLEKINREKPVLDDLGERLQKEHDQIINRNDAINKRVEELNGLKGKLDDEIKMKEAQIKEISMRKNKLEALYAREGTLQQQLKLENEINTTLILENEVLLKQHEFMSDKSTSNSLIFLMNESMVNKMSLQPNELIELTNDLGERKNSDTKETKKFVVSEFEKELKEKKILMESLKAQMKSSSNGNSLKEKFAQEMAMKITEIEDLLAISEEELGLLKS